MAKQQNSTLEKRIQPGFSPKPMMLSEADYLDATDEGDGPEPSVSPATESPQP